MCVDISLRYVVLLSVGCELIVSWLLVGLMDWMVSMLVLVIGMSLYEYCIPHSGW